MKKNPDLPEYDHDPDFWPRKPSADDYEDEADWIADYYEWWLECCRMIHDGEVEGYLDSLNRSHGKRR
jgi:hypothetical protein